MRVHWILLVAMMTVPRLAVGAEEKKALAPKSFAAKKAKGDFDRESEAAEKVHQQQLLAAHQKYLAALNAAKRESLEKKDLDESVAIEGEIKATTQSIEKLRNKLNSDKAKWAAFEVSGSGYVIADLENGGKAFGNRGYPLRDIPEHLKGWRYTRVDGNGIAVLKVKVNKPGLLVVASMDPVDELTINGWKKLPNEEFHYMDNKKTGTFYLLAKPVEAGSQVVIPPTRAFSRTVLLIPPD